MCSVVSVSVRGMCSISTFGWCRIGTDGEDQIYRLSVAWVLFRIHPPAIIQSIKAHVCVCGCAYLGGGALEPQAEHGPDEVCLELRRHLRFG